MRVLFGIILGILLTIGTAFVHDTWASGPTGSETTSSHRTMVNWDVVDANWHSARVRIEETWNAISRKVAS